MEGIRNGKNVIRLKGPGATLDIQQRYDGASDRMVPVDDETLQMLRKNLPPGKKFVRNKTNIINTRVADLLNKDGGTSYKTDIILTAGVAYGVQGIMNLTITLTNNDENRTQRHIFLRAIVCKDIVTDLIIGLPSILYIVVC